MDHTVKIPLFRPLTKRPTAVTITVRELVQKAQAGEVRVPHFQRPLRWTREDVVRLLDSIWRGYPVGSLLFWKRPADADRVPIGGAMVNAPKVADAWWVVDGQQRTTALAATLLDLDHVGDTRWVVRFDPERDEPFVAGPPPPERVGMDVPVSVLGDLRRLGRWLRDSALDEKATTGVEDAQQRLLDYAIPAYVVDTDDEGALRAVFARLNSTGARMRADEVFQALLGAPPSPGGPSLDLDELQRCCDLDGFGTPERAEVLKAVLAMSNMDPSRRLEDLGGLQGAQFVSREDAAEALSRTIGFLVAECGIPHISLIPYPVVFFILARWFHVHPTASDATRARLARWVWRGAVTGAHQRAEVSRMREQVRSITSEDEQGSLDRLLDRAGSQSDGSWELRPFQLRSARSRIETLALLAQRPCDPLGPVSVAALESGGRIAREIFRSSDWEGLADQDRALARTAANRAVLGIAHTGLSAKLKTWDADDPALASHLIDAQAFKHLRTDDVAAFLRRRGAAVRHAVEAFTARKAAWDAPNLRPVEAYLEADDA